MHIYFLLLFHTVQCNKYIIKTKSGKEVEVKAKAKTNVDHSLMHDGGNVKANTHLEHTNRHSKNKKKGHPKTSWDNEHLASNKMGLKTQNKSLAAHMEVNKSKRKGRKTPGQDYISGWLNECSLKAPCSEDSCMIQKDIPGCGGSIDLTCTGGCINILKVRSLLTRGMM